MLALFDLNGSLLDPSAMADPLGGGQAAEELADAVLADAVQLAMAETITGSYREFSALIELAAARRLRSAGRGDRLEAVVAAAGRMRPFPQAHGAIGALRDGGHGVGVLTNSSTETARELLAACDLDLDPVIGTDQVRVFKPDRRVYERALQLTGADPHDIVLISAHWWDAFGAKRAGLRAAWIARREGIRLEIGPEPDYQGADLDDVARAVLAAAAT